MPISVCCPNRYKDAFVCLVLFSIALGIGIASAADIDEIDLQGFKLGMSLSDVERKISTLSEIESERWIPHKSKIPTSRRLPTVYIKLKNADFIEIGFVRKNGEFYSAEVIQSKIRTAEDKLLHRFSALGFPDRSSMPAGSRIYAWGGRAESQGGITPLPGTRASLRLELMPDGEASIRLTGHALLEASQRR